MADATGVDLAQFERWYTQAGTPTVRAEGQYDAEAQTYTLTLSQSTPGTPGQPNKEPFHIPVEVALLAADGVVAAAARVLELTQPSQNFVFEHVASEPVPSVLRGFSAPVKLEMERSDEQLAFLAANDDDAFNKWDASQRLASRVLLELAAQIQAGSPAAELSLPGGFVAAFRSTLTAADLDHSLQAYSLTLPDFNTLSLEMSPIDPAALCGALKFARRGLAAALRPELTARYEALTTYYRLLTMAYLLWLNYCGKVRGARAAGGRGIQHGAGDGRPAGTAQHLSRLP